MQAQTIDEVISQLDGVIARAKREGSRLGYFPAMYRKVTIRVKEGIQQGIFEDNPRMGKLEVLFANRYIEAVNAYWNGGKPTRPGSCPSTRAKTAPTSSSSTCSWA